MQFSLASLLIAVTLVAIVCAAIFVFPPMLSAVVFFLLEILLLASIVAASLYGKERVAAFSVGALLGAGVFLSSSISSRVAYFLFVMSGEGNVSVGQWAGAEAWVSFILAVVVALLGGLAGLGVYSLANRLGWRSNLSFGAARQQEAASHETKVSG